MKTLLKKQIQSKGDKIPKLLIEAEMSSKERKFVTFLRTTHQ